MKVLRYSLDQLSGVVKKNNIKSQFITNKPYPHLEFGNVFSNKLLRNVVEEIWRVKNEKNLDWSKMCTNDFTKIGESIVKLTDFLVSEEWVNFLEEVTGIDKLISDPSWFASGINFEPRGAHLQPHTDFNVVDKIGWRRLNLLLYLQEGWKDEWGGHLELWPKPPNECEEDDVVIRKKPEFNNMIIFETSDISYHGFDIVRCPQDKARMVISCYYYSGNQGKHSNRQQGTKYVDWGKRDNKKDYSGRRGTGWKEIEEES